MNRCLDRPLRLFALLPLLLATALAWGQSKKELEKRRDALDKQIRTTTALIDQARKEQRVTQEQLQLLESQIAARAQLIRAMDNEVRVADDRIRADEEAIAALKADLVSLKEGYARMIAAAYRNRSAYDRLSYLFASSSFQQAFRRSRYINQLAAQRRRQAVLISETQASLDERVSALKEQRQEKAVLLSEQVQEKRRLDTDRAGQQQALNGLRKEESRLRETQKKQENQRRELEAAIRKAIEDAVKPKAGAKDASGKPAKLDITLTPEARELSNDFEKNKGKLPWPVEKGVITGRYGKQPHPVLKGIVIDNNGIDITTEKGAGVRALFRGEVTSVIVLPGAGKAVIVSHGAYRTVYSNLASVSVAKGDKLSTKQAIGTVLTGDDGAVAHIEVWRITADGLVNVDPALWLYRD
ncbi:MAG TPA: peptidoglycan DD-metalloendopeptidase family protein [Flavobacteriales bacterium]|nr:peptidoglycan DD-metalloendopeptidase family protein [Flavobacteriales bacterium]HRD51047.1 peptidoglycan DD-metalloendopeptidase family protein [Flavobacteriales bacterium]